MYAVPGERPAQFAKLFVPVDFSPHSRVALESALQFASNFDECAVEAHHVYDVPTGFDREPYYRKELELRMSCSYGPGRYDEAYEQRGLDYPAGYVRWTERRNFEAVLEAMACGTPVIAFNRGSMPELIEHGKNGFLVSGSQEAIEYVDRTKTINRVGCRQTVEDRFTADRMVEQYGDVYSLMLEKVN